MYSSMCIIYQKTYCTFSLPTHSVVYSEVITSHLGTALTSAVALHVIKAMTFQVAKMIIYPLSF